MVLLLTICVFFVEQKKSRTLLALICVLALAMPILFISYGLIYTMSYTNDSIYLSNIENIVWGTLSFSPTNFVLFFIVCRIKAVRRLRVWSVVAFLSAFLSWLGTAFLIYALS